MLDPHAPPVQLALVGGDVADREDVGGARAQVRIDGDAAELEIEARLAASPVLGLTPAPTTT